MTGPEPEQIVCREYCRLRAAVDLWSRYARSSVAARMTIEERKQYRADLAAFFDLTVSELNHVTRNRIMVDVLGKCVADIERRAVTGRATETVTRGSQINHAHITGLS